MNQNLQSLLKTIKETTVVLGQLLPAQKKKALLSLKKILQARKVDIFVENKKDIERAGQKGKNAAFVDRLTFTDKIFASMLDSLSEIADLDDPLGEIIEQRIISNGVTFQKVRVPLGVAGIIYESRPNITIEVFALCFKSSNACVLKGGTDAIRSNRILFRCIQKALEENHITKHVVLFLDTTDRMVVTQLLKQREYVDVIIPRGGYELVKKVVEESAIPVLYHSEGGARIYVDESADLAMALSICVNAKTSRPATCNSLDTVVVHEKIAARFLPKLFDRLGEYNVLIKIDKKDQGYSSKLKVTEVSEEDYKTEFLDYVIAIKIVKGIDEAIGFIQKYSKKHSEGIIAVKKKVIRKFVNSIDAAALFVNCSTRLHDGGVMGFGAEMGIATGKLHARGPVGLKELTTYKWVAYGEGQVRE
jgi:glutamate-5-semialdehyde dehydrogenase